MQTDTTATTTTASPTSGTGATAPRSDGRALLLAGARATGVAILTVMAAHGLSLAVGANLLVAGPADALVEVAAGTIVGMTLLGGTLAVLLALAAERWAPRPRTTFVVTAVVGVMAYAGVPFAAAESPSTALWLNAYHVAVATPLVALLARRLPHANVGTPGPGSRLA